MLILFLLFVILVLTPQQNSPFPSDDACITRCFLCHSESNAGQTGVQMGDVSEVFLSLLSRSFLFPLRFIFNSDPLTLLHFPSPLPSSYPSFPLEEGSGFSNGSLLAIFGENPYIESRASAKPCHLTLCPDVWM